jgi:hypothetical protein
MTQELRLHLGILRWWNMAASGFGVDPRLLAHAANGGKRTRVEGAIFKGMGVRPGHEDLFLSVPRGAAHGLYLELKAPDGRISPEQKEMMRIHEEQGYAVHVSWSFDEAVGAITRYLKSGNPNLK